MKKIIAALLTIAVAVWTFGPLLAGANGTISTSLTRVDGGTTGNDPIIKAKWEMYTPNTNQCGGTCGLGEDESIKSDAQFAAPGTWEGSMQYTVCAIVTDPNGVSDIDGVYVDIYYPDNKAFHYDASGSTSYNGKALDPGYLDLINGGTQDYGLHGCGEFIEENTLLPLSKANGIQLFCNEIQSNNNSLPTFFKDPSGAPYTYDEICGSTGELEKETAKVYCDDKSLTWEDPAGLYKVEAFAIDKSGNFSYQATDKSDIDSNYFEYLPLTGFEVDFTNVDYGNVALNSHKIVSGDLTWDKSAAIPSVRNVGNTRLYMWALQDDMGLGSTSGVWNVRYDARVGNEELEWRDYWPEQNRQLQDILDLSEIEEMDFSILVSKFPSTQTSYSGTMDLSATGANFRKCVPN